MPKTERELRRDIVKTGRLMYRKGWVAANDGNLSIRLDAERVLCTPTKISKGMMTPDDLLIVDLEGNKLEGTRERTSEIAMHLTIYSMRADVASVVHAHPPISTGFATAGRALNMALLPEVVVTLGSVPLCGYGLPGTAALSDCLRPHIPTYDALLMANHGVVCYGDSLDDAFFKMETVEHFARIALVAEILGGPKVLPRQEVEKLFDSRERYGVTSHARMEPGAPVVAEDRNGHYSAAQAAVRREEVVALIEEVLQQRGISR